MNEDMLKTLKAILSGGGGSKADGGTFTPGSDSATPIEGVYQSNPSAVADGKYGVVRISASRALKTDQDTQVAGEDLTNDVQGVLVKPVVAAAYSPTVYTALTQVTKANIKASAGQVYSIYITNDNAAVRYFQLHNKASAPAGADVPIYSVKVPAGTANNPGVLSLNTNFFTEGGKYFSTGIGWAISTTYATFTDSATNTEHIPVVHYI